MRRPPGQRGSSSRARTRAPMSMACPMPTGRRNISAKQARRRKLPSNQLTSTSRIKPAMDTKTSFAQGQLKSLVERIERLEEEKKVIAGDIKEVYAEAKANGFDAKILRKVIAIRKKDRHEREEEEAMLDLYLNALGMLPTEVAA